MLCNIYVYCREIRYKLRLFNLTAVVVLSFTLNFVVPSHFEARNHQEVKASACEV